MKEDKYADMYELPHHVSNKHSAMSLYNRAAQFAPFAALTGFDGCIDEEARLTDKRMEEYEEKLRAADNVLAYLRMHEQEHPKILIRYFVPDSYKAGGTYEEKEGYYKRLDAEERKIYFTDGTAISIDDISAIKAEGMNDEF